MNNVLDARDCIARLDAESPPEPNYAPRGTALHVVINNTHRKIAIHSKWFQESKIFHFEQRDSALEYVLYLMDRYYIDRHKHLTNFYVDNVPCYYQDARLEIFNVAFSPVLHKHLNDPLNRWFNSIKLTA